jgi:hypothetical protein
MRKGSLQTSHDLDIFIFINIIVLICHLYYCMPSLALTHYTHNGKGVTARQSVCLLTWTI